MSIRTDLSDRPSLSVFSPMMPGAALIKELEIGSFVAPPFPREWPETLRVVSWNVNRGLQLNGIIDFLQSSSADLILLQETDVNARRTRRRNIPREIAQALRMNYVFGCEFEELSQGTQPLLLIMDKPRCRASRYHTRVCSIPTPVDILASAMVHSFLAVLPKTAGCQDGAYLLHYSPGPDIGSL